jgi:hypothetical protein
MSVIDVNAEIEAEARCERLGLTTDVQRVVLFDHQADRLTLVAAAGFEGGFSTNAWDVTGVANHGCGIADMLTALDPLVHWESLEDWRAPRVHEDDLRARLLEKMYIDRGYTRSLFPEDDERIVAVVSRRCLDLADEITGVGQPVVELYPERCSEKGAVYLGWPLLHGRRSLG